MCRNFFSNFDADENAEESYDFAFTDVFLKKLVSFGVKPFFRLGVSIENYQAIKAYYIYPPKDFLKWARICEHIIRHYNEGWANGFYFGIEYWEIWNEQDNFPDICDKQQWKGTAEQFYEFYTTAANYLKTAFPHLKIGGYASCGFYAVLEKNSDPTAKVSDRTGYFIDFFRGLRISRKRIRLRSISFPGILIPIRKAMSFTLIFVERLSTNSGFAARSNFERVEYRYYESWHAEGLFGHPCQYDCNAEYLARYADVL